MLIEARVPATSANMGAGFDTLGIALSLYNTVSVEETQSGLFIENKRPGEFTPKGENNLIYRSVKRVFDEVGYIVCTLIQRVARIHFCYFSVICGFVRSDCFFPSLKLFVNHIISLGVCPICSLNIFFLPRKHVGNPRASNLSTLFVQLQALPLQLLPFASVEYALLLPTP